MASVDLWYLLQLAPIAIGGIFFLLASNINIGREKIALYLSEAGAETGEGDGTQDERVFDKRLPVLCAQPAGAKGMRVWKGYAGPFEDMRRRVFLRKAYDRLMQNGMLEMGMPLRKVERVAYERLGFVDIARFGSMKCTNDDAGKLALFVTDVRSTASCTLSFSRSSAIALSYLADYRLEVFCV